MARLDDEKVNFEIAMDVKIHYLINYRMTGIDATESGLKANSALDRFKKQNYSMQQELKGQELASAVERHKVEKLWEKDLINIINMANKLHEVGIVLCIHRLVV